MALTRRTMGPLCDALEVFSIDKKRIGRFWSGGPPPPSRHRPHPHYLSDSSHFAHPPILEGGYCPPIVADLHALRSVGRGAIEPVGFTGRPRLSYTLGHLPSQMLGQVASLPNCPLATGSLWGKVGACCHVSLTFSGGLGGYQGLTAPQKPPHLGCANLRRTHVPLVPLSYPQDTRTA